MELNEILETLDACVDAVLYGLQGCKQDPKGNIRVRTMPWGNGTGYTDLPMIEILGNEAGVRGFYVMPTIDGVPSVAVTHMLCAKLYMVGFVAADAKYQDYNSDSKSLLMVMPVNKQSDEDPAPPNTLRSYALTWFEQARKALDAEAGKDSGCVYLMQYIQAQDKPQQARLIAIADGSIVYECDIKDSVYYTSAEIASAIKAMVLDSDNMRIQKVDPDSRRFGVPPNSIHRLYLIDWLR